MARILVEGSSTAYGLWGGENGGWADRLKADLLANPNRSEFATVINLASPLREVDVIEETLLLNAKNYAGRSPARIGIFMLGMSESRQIDGSYAIPPNQFGHSVERISKISRACGYTAIFLGMTPISEERTSHLKAHYSEKSRQEYEAIIQGVADAYNDRYINLRGQLALQFPDTESILDRDGLHVNGVGHAAIHKIIAPVVYEELASLKEKNPNFN
jgi:lysophospholipase L1-like esterase